jgi:Transposase DDE domain
MITVDTFLTTLYVMADDFSKTELPPEPLHPGKQPALSRSEVITLAVFGQWGQFASERAFYRYALRHLRSAFPTLPDRSQFNRLLRSHSTALALFFHHLVDLLRARHVAYEALSGMGVATRNAKRRGAPWLPQLADIGWSNRLGYSAGFHVLTAVNQFGVLTGFGFGSASTKDQPLAETFLAARAQPHPRLLTVGQKASGVYLLDKGFEGAEWHTRWAECYAAEVICPPKQGSRMRWPKRLRRWFASLRQIVETAHEKLLDAFRLEYERPHDLSGFQARLNATMVLHNFCIWLNEQLGRPRLAFVDLIDW